VTEQSSAAGDLGASSNTLGVEKAVDVAIAEFNALRAEIITALTAQATFTGIAFTAIGVLFGFAVNKDGEPTILLGAPFISALTILAYTGAALRISSLGSYIRSFLWPYIRSKTDELIPSWEHSHYEHRASSGTSLAGNLTGVTVGSSLFVLGMTSAIIAPAPDALSTSLKYIAMVVLPTATLTSLTLLLVRRRDQRN
jgi:hypothetical protein